ncbi:MAG: type IV secretion system DNA-binding domain-containing protein, partial [Candidatus Niyogibacteria bacterium]|nr:type IV secretion system DNA-binding domain-containing protein [Candidatus Niyogibacteria bacterium]
MMLGETTVIYSVLILAVIAGTGIFLFARHIAYKARVRRSLEFTLYEITFSEEEEREEGQTIKNIIALMEQFYNGMAAISEGKKIGRDKNYFVVELALPHVGEETAFYVAVHQEHGRIFEKQLESLFPRARIEIKREDYNIFNADGASVACEFRVSQSPVLPIRTYDKLEADPLEVIANAFSKLKKEGEGAAFQLVIETAERSFSKRLKHTRKAIAEGKSLAEAYHAGWGKEFLEALHIVAGSSSKKEDKTLSNRSVVDEGMLALIDAKLSSPLFKVNGRLIASAGTEDDARSILKELSSAFLQFTEPQGNQFVCREIKRSRLQKLLYLFSFRLFDGTSAIYLNAKELTSIFHFPSGMLSAPKLKSLKSKDAPAPANTPSSGVLLGINNFRGERREIRMDADDRRRHFYIVGQTGTGKSEMMKGMIKQDIISGYGVCVLDPHGDMVGDLLGHIPEERLGDVIYFDPGNTKMSVGLNFLEYDPEFPEQKTFVVDELLAIFNKLYNMELAGGPMFEQYFRNATHLVLEDPASGSTLLEVIRVLSDKAFRDYKLSRSKNPLINSFWKEIAEKTGGEHSLQNMIPYITSKFDTFLSNEIMRPIIAQQHSSFNMRDVMGNDKVLLVNLSKGRVGELNSHLLGLVIVGKILMATFSRVAESDTHRRKDFFLYLDEFQNVTTPSIATILSEARKYRLNLVIAHQFIGQLSDEIRKAVFGNIGTITSFRVGREDAEVLEKQFAPIFSAYDLSNIENFRAYVKMLIRGQTSKPFHIQTLLLEKGNEAAAEAIKELSAQKYGRPRKEIEEEIA